MGTMRPCGLARTLVGDWGYPRLDPDGTMRTAARDRAAIWRTMYEAGIPFYAVEVMNEVNIGDGFPPEKYAQWLLDFAVEVKRAYPGLKVCSCGMAGSGAEYYDPVLAYRPELKDVVDFWGLHPYGANHPPEVPPAENTLRSYELTAEVLAKHGVDPIRLMCTETGYELEIGPTGKNPTHPPIREDSRAEHMARAFRDYYVPDPRIEMETTARYERLTVFIRHETRRANIWNLTLFDDVRLEVIE